PRDRKPLGSLGERPAPGAAPSKPAAEGVSPASAEGSSHSAQPSQPSQTSQSPQSSRDDAFPVSAASGPSSLAAGSELSTEVDFSTERQASLVHHPEDMGGSV